MEENKVQTLKIKENKKKKGKRKIKKIKKSILGNERGRKLRLGECTDEKIGTGVEVRLTGIVCFPE